jgi:hypothetical protein
MKKLLIILFLFLVQNRTLAQEDARLLVEFPQMMQNQMMTNMRDHLLTINRIQLYLVNDKMDKAAELAESHLGMGALKSHHAKHMSKFMPKEMAAIGTSMHKAASRFALKAEEGDLLPAYKALAEVTSACVACHAGYRIR